MSKVAMKEQVEKMFDRLPDEATWSQLEYEIYVRKAIEEGLEDARVGRVVSHEEVLREFGLEPEE